METAGILPSYTREELMEHFGLQVHDSADRLTGANANATLIREPYQAEMASARVGEFLACPPTNPDCRQTRTGRVEHGTNLHWSLRAEGPHWQGDIFVAAGVKPGFDPVYEYLDRLPEVFPQLLGAVESAEPWPQKHQSIHDAFRMLLHHQHRRTGAPPHLANLHQRYG
jgi:hypothetical protein